MTHTFDETVAVENTTYPEATGSRESRGVSFQHAADKASDVTIAAFLAEPNVSLVAAKPPDVAIIVPREGFIIRRQHAT